MRAYLESVRLEDGPVGGIFELAGVPPILPFVTYEEVEWAAAELGVELAPNFLYLDPYFEGRDTRVAPRPALTYIAGGTTLLLFWLSMIAAVIRRRWRRAAEANNLHRVAKKALIAAAVGGAKYARFGRGRRQHHLIGDRHRGFHHFRRNFAEIG